MINTSREKQNEKKQHTTKEQVKRTSQKNKQRQLNRKQTDQQPKQAENQKLCLSKRNHGRLAPGFAADAWKRRNTAVLWSE
ncbi:hypothetical protein [Bifidobacterium catenulatum]|uniref:hypothetical protein n=1 Tax=Bifidobacterium catenulatum TaxID=1686 RepID=UPI002480FC91|nr:hypothetical protein [Bifidobacterium catenulatum]